MSSPSGLASTSVGWGLYPVDRPTPPFLHDLDPNPAVLIPGLGSHSFTLDPSFRGRDLWAFEFSLLRNAYHSSIGCWASFSSSGCTVWGLLKCCHRGFLVLTLFPELTGKPSSFCISRTPSRLLHYHSHHCVHRSDDAHCPTSFKG